MHLARGLTFGLIQHDPGEDGEFSEFRVGLDHLALSVASRAELDKWVEHLDGCGVPHSGISDMSYGSVVVFRDPDNIQLELFALASDFRPRAPLTPASHRTVRHKFQRVTAWAPTWSAIHFRSGASVASSGVW